MGYDSEYDPALDPANWGLDIEPVHPDEAGSLEFEEHFCSTKRMTSFCKNEAEAKLTGEGAAGCSWNDQPTEDTRCYCGDLTDTPQGGSY